MGVYAGKPGQPSHGELLFSVLLEFWLTDGEDPALKDPKDSRLAPPLPYEAPTPDLLAALQVHTLGPCLTVCALLWTLLLSMVDASPGFKSYCNEGLLATHIPGHTACV